MDILAIVGGHLDFIERFYEQASAPFETIKRKIEAVEEPYESRLAAPEDYDGPEYEAEWGEADDSLRVLGNCALGLLAKAIQDYLREFIMREADIARAEQLASLLKGDGWFERYERFLLDNTSFTWGVCPVRRDRIEQIVLSRNDIMHDPTIDAISSHQSAVHFRKYPVSRFADWLDRTLLAASRREWNTRLSGLDQRNSRGAWQRPQRGSAILRIRGGATKALVSAPFAVLSGSDAPPRRYGTVHFNG